MQQILSLPSVEAAEQGVLTEQEASLEPNIAMEDKKNKKEISKGKKKMFKQDLQLEREEDINEEELNAYIQEEENARSEFPTNEDITLHEDMLSKHLTSLLVNSIHKPCYM